MIKMRNRRIALLLVLAMVATMFVGIGTASASASFSALTSPTVTANQTSDLGIIQVDITNGAALAANNVLTLSLPTTVTMATQAIITTGPNAAGTPNRVEIFVPTDVSGAASGNGFTAPITGAQANLSADFHTLNIVFNNTGASVPGRMFIYLRNSIVGSLDGDITAVLSSPNSGLGSGSVIIGKSTSSHGDATVSVQSVKAIATQGLSDVITIQETYQGALSSGDTLKVKLPAGYTWTNGTTVITQNWGFVGGAAYSGVRDADARILNIAFGNTGGAANIAASTNMAGKITFIADITVDDATAKIGDVSANFSDSLGRISSVDLVVAKYSNFGVSVNQQTTKTLTAGVADQAIGTFSIKEDLIGSLFPGRNIKFTLPEGVVWSGAYRNGTAIPLSVLGGSGTTGFTVNANNNGSTDSGRTIKAVVGAATNAKTEWKFENLKVDVSPAFTGDIKVTVSGTAGATGEVVVGTAAAGVTAAALNSTDVKIGVQAQALGDMTITETAKETILKNVPAIWVNDNGTAIQANTSAAITLTLPADCTWGAGFPTVEITAGDLQLDTAAMSKNGAVLTIPVKSSSLVASTIKISNMKATIYRTVPEGAFKITVGGSAINQTGGITAANVSLAFPQYEAAKVQVANVVTSASNLDTTNTSSFVVGASKYTLNGTEVAAFAAFLY